MPRRERYRPKRHLQNFQVPRLRHLPPLPDFAHQHRHSIARTQIEVNETFMDPIRMCELLDLRLRESVESCLVQDGPEVPR